MILLVPFFLKGILFNIYTCMVVWFDIPFQLLPTFLCLSVSLSLKTTEFN